MQGPPRAARLCEESGLQKFMLHPRPRQRWQVACSAHPGQSLGNLDPEPSGSKEHGLLSLFLMVLRCPQAPVRCLLWRPLLGKALAAPCSHIPKVANPPGREEPGQPRPLRATVAVVPTASLAWSRSSGPGGGWLRVLLVLADHRSLPGSCMVGWRHNLPPFTGFIYGLLCCNLFLKRLLYSSCDPCRAPRGQRAPVAPVTCTHGAGWLGEALPQRPSASIARPGHGEGGCGAALQGTQP